MHVVFTAPPAPGHVYPTLPLVEELVDRRHRVTYVSSVSLAAEIRHAGAAFVDLGWEPDTTTLAVRGLTTETLSADMRSYLAAARAITPPLLSRLGTARPDVVCTDTVPLGQFIAEVMNTPVVSLVATLATNEHFPRTELIDSFSPQHPSMLQYFAELTDWFQHYGLPVPNPDAASDPPTTSLVFTPKLFQIAGDTFDDSYRFIGSSVPSRARRTPLWRPPASVAPIVLASLGTAFNNQPEFFITCAEAFAGSDFHLVMAVGANLDVEALGSLPPNVEVYHHVPQLTVLQRATAFITHCGMGSTMEALYHEVPVVGVPQVREQVVNADRIQQLGLGHRLVDAVTADQLLEVTERTASHPDIRSNLAAMKGAIDDAGGASAGANVIESAAAT